MRVHVHLTVQTWKIFSPYTEVYQRFCCLSQKIYLSLLPCPLPQQNTSTREDISFHFIVQSFICQDTSWPRVGGVGWEDGDRLASYWHCNAVHCGSFHWITQRLHRDWLLGVAQRHNTATSWMTGESDFDSCHRQRLSLSRACRLAEAHPTSYPMKIGDNTAITWSWPLT